MHLQGLISGYWIISDLEVISSTYVFEILRSTWNSKPSQPNFWLLEDRKLSELEPFQWLYALSFLMYINS